MSAPGVVVRAAVPDDAPALAELRWEFRAARGPAQEDHAAFLARCVPWMRAALGPGGRWRAWLAERAGTAIGTAWLQEIDKIPNPTGEAERHAYVSNVYVRPAERGRGTGRALLEAAVARCRRVQPHAVILWPTDRSRTLYERAGFRPPEDMMELHVRVPPRAAAP